MAMRFRRSKKIAPGVRLTLGKGSASVRFGPRGIGVSKSTTGRTTTSVGVPGSGLSWTRSTTAKRKAAPPKATATPSRSPAELDRRRRMNRVLIPVVLGIIALLALLVTVL